MRLLVVDDDDTNRLVFRLLMERRGYVIFDADSGQAALEILSIEDLDLVFLDLSMPMMDGFETVRRFRGSIPARRYVPILALTSNTTPVHRQRCFDAGMDGLIMKPLNMAAVDAAMTLINPGRGRALEDRRLPVH